MPADVEQRLIEMEQRVATLETDSERNRLSHKEFYKILEDFGKDGVRTDEKFNTIMSSISELKVQVAELAAKPAKRWDGVVMAAITGIVGLAIGFLFK